MKIKTDLYTNTVLSQKVRLTTFCLMAMFIIVITGTANAQSLQTISPKQAQQLIQKEKDNSNFAIIDIRTPTEFESGHIENASLIDYYSKNFLKKMQKLDKNKIYLIYCRSSNRSTKALSLIKDMGFKSLYNMGKGINGWTENGYKIVR